MHSETEKGGKRYREMQGKEGRERERHRGREKGVACVKESCDAVRIFSAICQKACFKFMQKERR
jgi:hypothetical protein